MARAFFHDPAAQLILPQEPSRLKALKWMMRTAIGYGLRYGTVSVTDQSDGAAIWLPPSQSHFSFSQAMHTGMLGAPLRFGCGALLRLVRMANWLEAPHKRIASQPHWYLLLLAVDPDRQSQGLGRNLIQPGLSRADAEGLPCYLETFNEHSVLFYEKHGFCMKYQGQLPSGPTFWSLLRPGEQADGSAGR